jgi:hypothetical protein
LTAGFILAFRDPRTSSSYSNPVSPALSPHGLDALRQSTPWPGVCPPLASGPRGAAATVGRLFPQRGTQMTRSLPVSLTATGALGLALALSSSVLSAQGRDRTPPTPPANLL